MGAVVGSHSQWLCALTAPSDTPCVNHIGQVLETVTLEIAMTT
jgi:hypothetical protein